MVQENHRRDSLRGDALVQFPRRRPHRRHGRDHARLFSRVAAQRRPRLASKYGRRPVYVASYAIYLASAIWAIFDTSFGGFLAARIVMGLGAGAAETIAPITISDVFFLHERGTIMALYTSFLSVGVGFGMIISG